MKLTAIAPLTENPSPLTLTESEVPVPGDREVLIRVATCGVCHTEIDEIEGRTPPPVLPVTPGHQVVGQVVDLGPGVQRLSPGQRVGVGWIYRSDGSSRENLAAEFQATGRDVDGGYADFMLADERYAALVPNTLTDREAAPLLCAGAVGYRALMRASLTDGEALGLTGFGGSGHLVLQMARFLYPRSPVYVYARSQTEQAFSLELGADWAGDTGAQAPAAPQAIIDTTPAWKPVLAALSAVRPGGRVVINAISKEAGDRQLLADLDYASQLWREKTLTSVANVTADDVACALGLAAKAGIRPTVEAWPLEKANEALLKVRAGHLRGAQVLDMSL